MQTRIQQHLMDLKVRIFEGKQEIERLKEVALDKWLDGDLDGHDQMMDAVRGLERQVKSLEMEIEYRTR